MFTVDDLQKEMVLHNDTKQFFINCNEYRVLITYNEYNCCNPRTANSPFDYKAVEIAIHNKAWLDPRDISGFIWNEFFRPPTRSLGQFVPLKIVCDIINFFKWEQVTSTNDIICPHCKKPNDYDKKSCWWCERVF